MIMSSEVFKAVGGEKFMEHTGCFILALDPDPDTLRYSIPSNKLGANRVTLRWQGEDPENLSVAIETHYDRHTDKNTYEIIPAKTTVIESFENIKANKVEDLLKNISLN